MKKTIVILTIAVFGLSAHSYNLKTQLETVKEVKFDEILGVMNEREEMYTKLPTGTLPEPSGTESADVLERIEMLKQHVPYQPSPEWILNVINVAETEIKGLRGIGPRNSTSYHPQECTRHMR